MVSLLIAVALLPKSAKLFETPLGTMLKMDGRICPMEQPEAFPFEQGIIRNSDSNRLEYSVEGKVVSAADWAQFRPTRGSEYALTECMPSQGGDALGIVTARKEATIEQPFTHLEYPVTAQYLVRFSNSPFRLTVIRELPPAGKGNDPHFAPRRLFRWPKAVYCVANGALEAIDWQGRKRLCPVNWCTSFLYSLFGVG